MTRIYEIGYNSAYLDHLAKLAKEAKERFEGVPPFTVLIAVAIFVHFSFLVPIYILDITKDVPDLKQVRVAFGVDTSRVKTNTEEPSLSADAEEEQDGISDKIVNDIDSILSPAAPTAAKARKAETSVTRTIRPNIVQPASTEKQTASEKSDNASKARKRSMRRPAPARGVRSTNGVANAGDSSAAVRAVKSKYERLLSGWVDRHKVYPDAAYRSKTEGEVVLRLRINRKGYVIIKSIEKSSGHDILDKAVLETVSRASPMPVVPEEYPGGKHLEFLIPINFRI